jgi:hypothetical protein
MSRFVIIMYTLVNSPIDLQFIKLGMEGLEEIQDWSLDLDDCDKVLRLVTTADIGAELLTRYHILGLKVKLMEVFDRGLMVSF